MPEVPPRPGEDALARRLRWAQGRLAACDLPPEARARLQRQFIAVCDAAKAPASDAAACWRRLEAFVIMMDNAIAQNDGYKNRYS